MSESPTALERHLSALIAAEGPIPVSRFMAEALMHPEHGYYRRGDPFGAGGDFVTAPEISQVFGELIGLWLGERWDAMGRPANVRLVELGPGRGTLMVDVMRALRLLPELAESASLHLVESNATLRGKQAQQLQASWHDSLEEVPDGPLFLIANEFFDALPIRQFVKTDDGWRERLITAGESGLAFVEGPAGDALACIPEALLDAPAGAIAEVSPESLTLMEAVAGRIARDGGTALIIDYGYTASAAGESLQAVRRHQPVDVFHRPGESDLTAHVNFEQLAQAAERAGAATAGPIDQGDFLQRLGIEVRAAMLARRATPHQARDIHAGVRRLTAPDMMGELFKVLAVVPEAADLPGFTEPEDV